MAQTTSPQVPIGYWLRHVDALLTAAIDRAQAQHGVTRTEWQSLNFIAENGQASREQLDASLAPFADPQQVGAILTQLQARGWITADSTLANQPAAYYLTGEGRRQHAAILATQKEVRQRTMQGVSQEEYAAVVRVLQQIAANLEDNPGQ